MLTKLGAFNVTVRVEDAEALIRAARAVGWSAVDSGERLTTEEGVDREAVLVLRVPAEVALPRASEA